MATTGICNSFKVEVLMGGHCFAATQSGLAGAGVSAAFTLTGLATVAGLSVGMAASGTNVAAGAVIASIDSTSQVTVSKAHTGTVTSGTIAFTGDVFKIALVKVAPSLTYSATQTNIGTPGSGTPSTSNLGTDEASGTGYTSGGLALTNVTPALSSTTAAIVYNTNIRLGAAATPFSGRTVGVYDFGGTVSSGTLGTLTLTMPVNAAGTALIQLA